MLQYTFKLSGIETMLAGIRRNPRVVQSEASKFVTRATAKYMGTIKNDPWRIGRSGGGVPVKTGNLRDTHLVVTSPWFGLIQPLAPYASSVAKKRPWLDYAFDQNQKEVEKLEAQMMENIITDLKK